MYINTRNLIRYVNHLNQIFFRLVLCFGSFIRGAYMCKLGCLYWMDVQLYLSILFFAE